MTTAIVTAAGLAIGLAVSNLLAGREVNGAGRFCVKPAACKGVSSTDIGVANFLG